RFELRYCGRPTRRKRLFATLLPTAAHEFDLNSSSSPPILALLPKRNPHWLLVTGHQAAEDGVSRRVLYEYAFCFLSWQGSSAPCTQGLGPGLALAGLIIVPNQGWAAAGDLDTSFGTGGKVTTDFAGGF